MDELGAAIAAFRANDVARCERLLRQILARESSHALALGWLGAVLAHSARDDEARAALATALSLGARADQLNIAMAGLIRKSGTLSGREAELLAASLAEPTSNIPQDIVAFYSNVFEALGLLRHGEHEWSTRVFQTIIAPWLDQLVTHACYAHALLLEYLIYDEYVKQRETEDHFRFVYQAITPALRRAGLALRDNADSSPKPSPSEPPRLAFLIHSANTLAHVEALRHMLDGYGKLPKQPWQPLVYCLVGYNNVMDDWFGDIDIEVKFLDMDVQTRNQSILDKLTWLRQHCTAEAIKGLVWLSAPVWMTTAFSMRIAEVQIWWAMKYHSISLPEIDMYVSSLSFKRTQHKFGNLWHTGRLQITRPPKPKAAEKARTIRSAFTEKVVLGSLGREEKLSNPEFLAVVIELLRANPETVYLWTGRKELDSIKRQFIDHGVANQTRFVGWVDTATYAQVLDIFLDPFPFGCGFTAIQSMAAGVPVIIAAATEDGTPNLDQLIWPLLSSDEVSAKDRATAQTIFYDKAEGLLYQRALDTTDYIRRAQRLVSDAGYRQRVGASYQAFVSRMMSDPVESAAIFSEHFDHALSEKQHGG